MLIGAATIQLTFLGCVHLEDSSCTASLVSCGLLLRSLDTIGFRDVTETDGSHGAHPCDVTEINLEVNDRAHGDRENMVFQKVERVRTLCKRENFRLVFLLSFA